MPPAFANWLRKNTSGPLNQVGLAAGVIGVATAQNKFAELLKMVRDFALVRITWPIALVGTFTQMGRTIRAILHDTGSLDAALRRMASIQSLQRTFAPFVGGIENAKRRVAELVQFTNRSRLFPLDDVGNAAQKLEVLTRGTYSSTQALSEIQDAAARSGNGIAETAEAVGQFYDNLREGRPIDSAAEQLRQMGVISQETARNLTQLQASGADANQVFDRLRQNMGGGGAQGAGDDVAAVNRQHEEAGNRLREAFGQPFTRDQIENTKNWTAVMQAMTPVVGRLASFFAILINGLSTTKSTFGRWAAESKGAQLAIELLGKALGVVAAVVTAFSLIALPVTLLQWAGAAGALAARLTGLAVAATGVRVALQALAIGTGVLAVFAILATGIGVVLNYNRSQEESARQARDMAAAHREAAEALERQIKAMQTLQDWHEAIGKAIAEEIRLEEELADARAKEGGKAGPRTAQALQNLDNARKQTNALLHRGPAGLVSPQSQENARVSAQAAIQAEEDAFQRALTVGGGGGRVAALRGRAAVLAAREQTAAAGRQGSEDVANLRASLEAQLAGRQRQLREFNKAGSYVDENGQMRAGQNAGALLRADVASLQRRIVSVGLAAPEGSATNLSARAQMVREGQLPGGPIEAQRLEVQAQIARQREQDATQRSKQLEADADASERQLRIQTAQADLAHQAIGAEVTGQSARAVSLRDLSGFIDQYERNRGAGYSDQDARTMAQREAEDSIRQDVLNRPSVVDSLQRIGLGGNIGGSDPVLDVQRRIATLQETAVSVLQEIASNTQGKDGQKVVGVFSE